MTDYTVEERNRFKGLDLIDRVPDELWTEVRDIVQETGSKTIPKKKKCKKAKWLSGEALQIAEKRKEMKSKGEKERYTHLNAQFQRIARRDKKAFLSDQCKEIKKKISRGHRIGKGVFIPIPKKGNAKKCLKYCPIALISHTSKVIRKILQARLQQLCDP